MMRDHDPREAQRAKPNPWDPWGGGDSGSAGALPQPALDPDRAAYIEALATVHAPAAGRPSEAPAPAPSAAPVEELATVHTAAPGRTAAARPAPARSEKRPAKTSAAARTSSPVDRVFGSLGLGNAADSGWQAMLYFLRDPFPRKIAIYVALVPFGFLLLGFLIQTLIARGDWAQGSFAAGIDALLLGGAVVVGAVVRYQLGRRANKSLQLSGILAGVLVVTGVGGMIFAHTGHLLIAQSMERSGKYQSAVSEYQAYGEKAPNAPNVARAEVEWGEQLLGQKQYSAAATHLDAATSAYKKDQGLTDRANKDLFLAYSAWMEAGGTGMPYGTAAAHLAAYRTSNACDASCKPTVGTLEAQVRYLDAGQLASKGDPIGAAAEFDAVQAQFPNSQFAANAHTEGAKVYLAYGQAQLDDGSACAGSSSTQPDQVSKYQQLLATFKTLSTNYSDTPEGQQAAQMLAAPQQVTGTVTNLPTTNPLAPRPIAYLSKAIDESKAYFSDEFKTPIGKDGTFTFSAVAQGDYNLHTERDLGNQMEFRIKKNAAGNPYAIHVGPLCGVSLGQIPY
jgi:tetratricopeptide (TPR) repeat protein